MRCLFFICSESVAIDAATSRLSIYHVTEELTATSFPVLVPQLHIVAMLERTLQDSATFMATAAVTLDGAQIGNEMSISVDFKEHERTKVVANIQGIVLPKPGKVRVLFKSEKTVLGVWEVPLRFVRQQGGTPPEFVEPQAVAGEADRQKKVAKK
jgi:hypothetical protein